MPLSRRLVLGLLLSASVASAAPAAPTGPAAEGPGLDLAAMDRSVAPGDAFYDFANGAWLRTAVIPADRSSWGVDPELVEITNKRVADLIQEAARTGADRKVADFYTAYLNLEAIDRRGLEPLKAEFARIDAIASLRDLSAEFGRELRADVDPVNNTHFNTPHLFGLFVEQNLNDPHRMAAYLLQGGLSLPDREYYLSPAPRMAEIRQAFTRHLETLLTLLGEPDPAAGARAILDLETRIASVHATRAESEDVKHADNPWTRASFSERAPGLDWNAFFSAAGLAGTGELIVWHPAAIPGEAALAPKVPLAVWRLYLKVHLADERSSVLPAAFRDERFRFYAHILSGTPEAPPRWKQAVGATNAALGEAVGRLYVARWFPPSSKAEVEAMVRQLLAAFHARIERLSWMAPATKAEALRKLSTLKVGVGYPDHWIDYSGLVVSPDDAFANVERAQLFEYRRNLAKLGRAPDRGEWAMTPQTVNAVNLPIRNAINFPAAILQAPNFDPRNPPAINFGGTGATIGHEISHSFDDQGALFDADGRLRNWWTPADFAHFRASAEALARQYSAYRPFPDLALNGEQVLSENIADLAGLNAAYDAYRAASGGGEGPALQGFTGDQQFFIAFAQSWRVKIREAALRQEVVTDGHAPPEYRADTVRNLDAWYPAFEVRPEERLYLPPDERVRIW